MAKTTSRKSAPAETGSQRVEAVMKAAKRAGLLGDKSARIGGRISPALMKQAKKRTAIAPIPP